MTPRSSEFSVRSLVRVVRDDLGTGDRHQIAKEALTRIAKGDRDAALLQALEEVARFTVVQGHPKTQAPTGAGQVNAARSSKVSAIRTAWLKSTYACLDPSKPIADYDSEDLIFVAEHLEQQADRNRVKASRFRDLAAALTEHDAAKVSDLPEAVLAAAFAGAEAA